MEFGRFMKYWLEMTCASLQLKELQELKKQVDASSKDGKGEKHDQKN